MENNIIPMKKEQVAGFYRFMLGDFEINALYDSSLQYPPEIFSDFTSLNKEQIEEMLDNDFAPKTDEGLREIVLNAYLINTGNHLILVDAGIGEIDSPVFIDKKGHLVENIKAAGYTPEQIDIILPTHLHFDHISGIEAKGKMVFPNATVYLAKEEQDFWLSKPVEDYPQNLQEYVKLAQMALEPYKKAGRIKIFNSGDEIIENIKSVPLFGHTPGQVGFLFSSKDTELLISGDFIHIKSVQLNHPEIGDIFDINPIEAGKTRLKVLPKIAERKMLLAVSHFPFPGIGHIRKTDSGYEWHQIEYSLLRK